MPNEVLKVVESVLAEKTAVAAREKDLIDNLNRILPTMGYRVVPVNQGTRAARRGGRLTSNAARTLACPHCERRFAHPLHLGRHVGAMHKAKRRRSRRAGKKKKAASSARTSR